MAIITVEDALSSFGLSEKEVKLYLAMLELGTATANRIADKSYINRSTTYDILKAFLEKGIASKVVVDGTANFEVASPEKLISMLEEKKEKLKSVLGQLKIIKEQTINKPRVEVFQGKDGFKTVLDDILVTKKDNVVISTSKIFEIMQYYFPQYIKKRKELGIKTRVLQEESAQTKELKKKDKAELRQTRSIKSWNINSTIFIYAEKVAIIKLVENEIISVLINDGVIADDYRLIFEILWKAAE